LAAPISAETDDIGVDFGDMSELMTPWNETNEENEEDVVRITPDCLLTPAVEVSTDNSCSLTDGISVLEKTPVEAVSIINEPFTTVTFAVTGVESSVTAITDQRATDAGKTTDISNDAGCMGTVKDSKAERICPGHERALVIEECVRTLDMKEEGI